MTERPELFKVVACQYPLLDMVRYQGFLLGKLWVSEYGSAEDASQFAVLYKYSPYHHVKKGVKYPAVLLTTGINDPRVEPWMSAKMAARLQAATTSDKPVLLRIDYDAGHGFGSTKRQRNEQNADIYAFLFQQLGSK